MLDSLFRPLIDPPLNHLARWIGQYVTPDLLTWSGFILGMLGAVLLSFQLYLPALMLILVNRLSDGLDGAVARQKNISSDRGGYIDIIVDFIFYSGVVFFFALGHPEQALFAAFLIYSFIGTGSSFLSYAIIAGKRGLSTEARGKKSFFHSGGLCEGSETILVMVLICLMPDYFHWIAVIFGTMCWITTMGRIRMGLKNFN
jgi:phosphatidylglycerophosphate synthase